MTNMDVQHDVIVIGAGIAGLVAANRAAQLGKRVIVLEKSKEDRYLCNSRYTYGTFHINFTDVGADEDVLFGKIEACSEGFAREDLARAVAKDGRRLMQWLKTEGVDLVDLGGYQTNVLAPPWREGFGLTWRGYSGDVALARLEQNLRQRQGRILRGMRARALQLVAGGIDVEADAAEGAANFKAASVVIADGGFQANLDLIRAHISSAPEKLLARNGGTATGDGLRMAEALGAARTGLDMFYGHLHSRDAMSTVRLWPRPYVDELAAAGIVIDADGRRFADEGLGGIYLSNAVARLGDPLGATIVLDQAIWDGPPGRGHTQPPNPLLSSRQAARCIAPARSRSWPDRSASRRSGWRSSSASTTPPSTPAPCTCFRPRAVATDTEPGRSGPRRFMPCRSARPSPTRWAASWSTATAPCSTRATRRCRACSRQAPLSGGWTAARTPATSAD